MERRGINTRDFTRHLLTHETDQTARELLSAMQAAWPNWRAHVELARRSFEAVRQGRPALPDTLEAAQDEARGALGELMITSEYGRLEVTHAEMTAIMCAFEETWLQACGMELEPFDRLVRRFWYGYRGETIHPMIATCRACGHAERVYVRRSIREQGFDLEGVCLVCAHAGLVYVELH